MYAHSGLMCRSARWYFSDRPFGKVTTAGESVRSPSRLCGAITSARTAAREPWRVHGRQEGAAETARGGICAPDFAFAQFAGQTNWAAAAANQPTNVVYLVRDVIELENDWICFAAIGAAGPA
jgi:hypothetical protein